MGDKLPIVGDDSQREKSKRPVKTPAVYSQAVNHGNKRDPCQPLCGNFFALFSGFSVSSFGQCFRIGFVDFLNLAVFQLFLADQIAFLVTDEGTTGFALDFRFVGRTGDVHRDGHADFGVKGNANVEQAQRLDGEGENNLLSAIVGANMTAAVQVTDTDVAMMMRRR